ANGHDGFIMGGLLALPRWNTFMGNPSGAYLDETTRIYWLGKGLAFPEPLGRGTRNLPWISLVLSVVTQTAVRNEKTFTYSTLFI
ncbi:hypothetical protein LX32DRAFT_602103, partial [Colletotrichum zoysiae]